MPKPDRSRPKARVLDAAERQVGRGDDEVVDEHHARVHLRRDPFAAGHVGCDDGAAQAVRGVVGQGDGFRLAADAADYGNGREELLPESRVAASAVTQTMPLYQLGFTVLPEAFPARVSLMGALLAMRRGRRGSNCGTRSRNG